MRRHVELLAMAVLALAGCASAPPAGQVRGPGLEANERAHAALARSDYARAAALFEQARRADAAVENAAGVALNTLALAAVRQRMGARDAAHTLLDALLAEGGLPHAAAHRAEAAARKSLLHLEAGQAGDGAHWAGRALELCGAPCALAGAIHNLSARAQLAQGDHAAALARSAQALQSLGESGDAGERANALRLGAHAQLALGSAGDAARRLGEALEIDRALARPALVFEDLMLLGRAALAQGDAAGARRYFDRARSVAEAMGDEARARDARAERERS